MKEWKNTNFQGFWKGNRIFIKWILRYDWVRKNVRFAMLIGNNFTNVFSGKVNIFWGNFYMGNITVKHKSAEKQSFKEFLKGARKLFQFKKQKWEEHMRKNERFPVKYWRTPDDNRAHYNRAHDNFNKLFFFPYWWFYYKLKSPIHFWLNRYEISLELEMRMSQCVSIGNSSKISLAKCFPKFSQF